LVALLQACVFWDMGDWSPSNGGPATEAGADDATAERSAADATTEYPDAPPTGYAAVVLADNPLGYWPLDEASGTVAHDVSGQGHDATVEGSVAFGAVGAVASGRAATFTGGRLLVGDMFGFAGMSAGFSIEVWMKPTTIDGMFRRVGGKESPPAEPRQGWDLWLHDDPPARIGLERLVDGTSLSTAAGLSAADAGNSFIHVVATHAMGTSFVWINGVLAETGTTDARMLKDHSGAFIWGNSSFADAPFEGDLDELAIYGSALSEARVLAHYAAGRSLGP
jgi:hypothetical protein